MCLFHPLKIYDVAKWHAPAHAAAPAPAPLDDPKPRVLHATQAARAAISLIFTLLLRGGRALLLNRSSAPHIICTITETRVATRVRTAGASPGRGEFCVASGSRGLNARPSHAVAAGWAARVPGGLPPPCLSPAPKHARLSQGGFHSGLRDGGPVGVQGEQPAVGGAGQPSRRQDAACLPQPCAHSSNLPSCSAASLPPRCFPHTQPTPRRRGGPGGRPGPRWLPRTPRLELGRGKGPRGESSGMARLGAAFRGAAPWLVRATRGADLARPALHGPTHCRQMPDTRRRGMLRLGARAHKRR